MEKQYFYTDGREKYGPFSLEQLKGQGIDHNTLVWTEGMGDWAAASSLAELKEYFDEMPPPLPKDNPQTNYSGYSGQQQQQKPRSPHSKPPNYMVQCILTLLFCCWPFAIPALVAASKVDSCWAAGDYTGADKASEDARKWVTVSFVVGLIVNLLGFILVLATSDLR